MQKHAEGLLKYYQPLLRLSDWDITIAVLDNDEYTERHGEEFHESTGACNEIVTCTRKSHICLRYEEQPQPLFENLIHELVHLMIQDQYKFSDTALDSICNTEAKTILKQQLDQLLEVSVSNVTKAVISLLLVGGKLRD